MSEELQPTLGAKMRQAREQGVVLPFPSGNAYRVRRPSAGQLLQRGNLPNPLLTFLIDVFYNGATRDKFENFMVASERKEKAIEMMQSLAVICEAGFLEPRVVENPQADNEVAIADVPMEDQVWQFQITFLGVDDLRPFREESQTPMDSVPSPENVPPSPKRRSRSRR